MTEPVIKYLKIKNLKALEDAELKLAPITLLFGANSSGKTTLIQSLLLLKGSLEHYDKTVTLVTRSPYIDIGNYKDFVSRGDVRNDLEISIGFSMNSKYANMMPSLREGDAPTFRFRLGLDVKDKISLKEFCFEFDGTRLIVADNRIQVSSEGRELSFPSTSLSLERRNMLLLPLSSAHLILENIRYLESNLASLKSDILEQEQELRRVEQDYAEAKRLADDKRILGLMQKLQSRRRTLIELQGRKEMFDRNKIHLMKEFGLVGQTDPAAVELIGTLLMKLRNAGNELQNIIIERTKYIGPLRTYPQRRYLSSNVTPTDVGTRGEHVAEIIYQFSQEDPSKYQILTDWIRKLQLGDDLTVQKNKDDEVYSVSIKDPHTQMQVNILDIGFGVSQILPILVQGILAKPGTVIIIEQPEIHLHPKLQGLLTDFFMELAKEGKQIIIETHSEHILRRLQTSIRHNDFSYKNVAVYYFENSRKTRAVRNVELREDGTLPYPPSGFFEESFNEAMRFIKEKE